MYQILSFLKKSKFRLYHFKVKPNMKNNCGRQQKFKKYNILFWLLVLLIFVNCQPTSISNIPEQNILISTLPAVTRAVIIETPTPTDIPPTLVATPTFIQQSIVPMEEKINIVQELFKTNGGCLFPCWWGLVPGEANWEEVEEKLKPFSIGITQAKNEQLYVGEVQFPIGYSENGMMKRNQYYVVQNQTIVKIEAEAIYSNLFAVDNIFKTYGPPSEIWIQTAREPYQNSLPFFLIFFYNDTNFIVMYSGKGQLNEGNIEYCLANHDESLIFASWSNSYLTGSYLEIAKSTKNFRDNEYQKPLEEATALDVASFYDLYKIPNQETCLITPANLWPAP